jgi:two-component system, sporulation sensor kinase B
MITTNMVPLLFTNMFFVIFSLLIYHLFVMDRDFSLNGKRIVIFLLGGSTLILCITFPVILHGEFLFDLRQIPLIIGYLYGGPAVGTGLYLLLLAYRFSIGGFGAILALIENGSILIALYFIYKRFQHSSIRRRYSYIVCLSILSFIISIILYLLFTEKEQLSHFFMTQVELNVVQLAVLLLAIYFIEIMLSNIKIREKLIKAEKVEIVSHLAASISHEVRNPLTVSRGFLQLLNDSTLSPQNRSEYVHIAIKEIDRSIQIITNYLAYAKPSVEKRESLDMALELTSVLEVMTPFANMRSVQLTNRLTPNYLVVGDKQKFKQSIVNILKNSIEAMPNGGTIHVNSFVEGSFYLISIEDNGIGMTIEQLERLGEPYFSTKEKGTGLGMMVVYSNIKSMNGKISVTSDVGKGTKFTIQFIIESDCK